MASSSPSRSESSSGRMTPGLMGAFFLAAGESTLVTVVAAGSFGCRLFSAPLSLALLARVWRRAAIFALVSRSFARGLAAWRGGLGMEVGSLTGMMRRLAVIFTNLLLGELAAAAFLGSLLANLTGVIISFGGGVLGLGGRMVTFTSMGCCLGWPVTSSMVPWSAGLATWKPALAVRQEGSDQA